MRRTALLTALAVLSLPAAPAGARTLTVRLRDAPEATLSVPSGWRARKRTRSLVLTKGAERVVVRICPLDRAERIMSGRRAARIRGGRKLAIDLWGGNGFYVVPAAGGGCATVTGGRRGRSGRVVDVRPAKDMADQLDARLGPPTAPPPSDGAAERLARAARANTLSQPRATGTAFALPFGAGVRIDSTWEWDLTTNYVHQVDRLTGEGQSEQAEVVRGPGDDHVRQDGRSCWNTTPEADEDDALEPRLELEDWNAPPSRATSWRVAYQRAETLPDGSQRLRWTGFVANGEAIVTPDGFLRSVRIRDHHQAVGRTVWRVVGVTFTGFPAAIQHVMPTPECGGD